MDMESILKQKMIDDGQKFYQQIMRQQRDNFLKETDKYLLPDYPITPEKLSTIKEYRQALRDFTINNYVLPEKPEFLNILF
jgi:hypothetical protein